MTRDRLTERSTEIAVFEDGSEISLVPFGNEERFMDIYRPALQEYPVVDRCYECGADSSSVHRLGCTLEECPACRESYIFCDCVTEEKESYYLWYGDVDVNTVSINGERVQG